MSDGFRDGQELTRALRAALKDVRGDVEAIVRREVERAGIDETQVRALVRRAVAAELDARTPWALARIRWVGPAVGLAVGLALGLSVFAVYAARGADRGAAVPAATATADSAASAAEQTVAPARPAPAQLVARYDSLFEAAAPPLGALVDRLSIETRRDEVRTAVAAWKQGRMSADQRERLHAALVQSVLRAEIDSTLAIDGSILREPCGGRSCAALLRLWEERGPEFGLPVWPGVASADGVALRTVERLLVLDRAERAG